MELLGLLLKGLFTGCFITFVVVTTTLLQARSRVPSVTESRPGSVVKWVIGTVVGLVIWAFVIAALLGFGLSHGSLGTNGIVANILLFGGPALYLYSGYRRIEAVKMWRSESSSNSD
jgi:hypothetical protein